MNEQSAKNKIAWEYRAYEFWRNESSPQDLADEIKVNPLGCLRKGLNHQKYFQSITNLKIANPCGSNGRKAVPLALLGAGVTVFDISEGNRRYALELAECANVKLQYELGDFYDIDLTKYSSYFDMLYLEGGILHYFGDIERLTGIFYTITKPGGKLVLSDFHPFRKINLNAGKHTAAMSVPSTSGDYFDSGFHMRDVAYKSFFPANEQNSFPDCECRLYTLSEIINAVINTGFTLKEFNEHPNWDDKKLPGEFTIYAVK